MTFLVKIKRNYLYKSSLIFFTLFIPTVLLSAPFSDRFTYTQPGGEKIILWGHGDEYYAEFETLDGFSVVFDTVQKAYFYAALSEDGSTLLSTGTQVTATKHPALGTPKHLRINQRSRSNQIRRLRKARDDITGESKRWNAIKTAQRKKISPSNSQSAPAPTNEASSKQALTQPELSPSTSATSGLKIGLCMLIEFSDADTNPDSRSSISQSSINDYCNGDNYTGFGNNGSVKQYFLDNSNGLLTYTNIVTAFIRLPNPKSYYNDITKDAGVQGRLLLQDAIIALT